MDLAIAHPVTVSRLASVRLIRRPSFTATSVYGINSVALEPAPFTIDCGLVVGRKADSAVGPAGATGRDPPCRPTARAWTYRLAIASAVVTDGGALAAPPSSPASTACPTSSAPAEATHRLPRPMGHSRRHRRNRYSSRPAARGLRWSISRSPCPVRAHHRRPPCRSHAGGQARRRSCSRDHAYLVALAFTFHHRNSDLRPAGPTSDTWPPWPIHSRSSSVACGPAVDGGAPESSSGLRLNSSFHTRARVSLWLEPDNHRAAQPRSTADVSAGRGEGF